MRTFPRLFACLILLTALTSHAEDLTSIDVSGKKGADGRDGTNRTGSAGTNQHGDPGGDAGPAERGQDAGDISLTLQSSGQGKLVLQGTYRPAGGQKKEVREVLTIGKEGYIPLKAKGGEGGRGGDGGRGEDGGRGSDGSDATQYSNGTNGHRGGDGGAGGDATSGERGGDGGKIHVRVSGDDTHLVMLILPAVKGGKGGRAGENGRGGSGGSGGRGGSSYSWTESHTRLVTSTDSDGKTTTSTETYYTHHSNPGGSNGASGSSGRNGNAAVKKGEDGPNGEYKIIVSDKGKTREYSERYDMEIVDFRIANDNGDSIFEPGETATIEKLKVQNTGGMPTPPNHPVTVYLASSEWVIPQPVQLTVPKSLDPDETYTFQKETLPFKIPDTQIVSVDEPFIRKDHTRPLAFQAEVNRPYTNFDQPHEFQIEFPIKIEPVHAVETLAAGDLSKMAFKVTNISGRDFGGESDLKRQIVTVIGMGNHVEVGNDIVLMDKDGNVFDWTNGLPQEIATLKAGQSALIEGMMGVLPTADSYTGVAMQVDLQLGKIDKPGDRKVIQRNTYPVRIGERYKKTEGSDILLVTNHGTTQEEIEAWRALAQRSGKKLDVWDVSLNNYLDLDRSVSQGQGTNLLKDFHGKTIVVLNNKFKTVEGDKHSDQLMGQMDLIRSTASHGARILVVNEGKHDVDGMMSDRLIPTDKEIEYGYQTLWNYLAGQPSVSTEKGSEVELGKIFDAEAKTVEEARSRVKINPTDTTGQIPIVGYRRPNEKRLAAQAQYVQSTIEARNPGARVVVTYDVGEEGDAVPDYYAKKEGWFGKYRLQGTLTVRPTVNDMQPNILVIDVHANQLHDPAFIASEAMNAALTQSFNFEDKLSALDKVLAELDETAEGDPELEPRTALGRKLVDGLLVDLAVEQNAILRHGWKSGLSSDTLAGSMPYLNRVGTYQTALDLTKPSVAADLMADLVAGITFLGKNQARWYERMPFPWGPYRRGPAVSAHTQKMAAQLSAQVFGPPATHSTALKDGLYNRVVELTKRRNEIYGKKGSKLTVKQSAVQVLLEPLLSEDVTMDALYTFNRVLAQKHWDEIHQNENRIEARRREHQAAKEEQKSDYLVVNAGVVTDPANTSCAAKFLEMVNAGQTTPAAAPAKAEAVVKAALQ